ncbi:DinB family protein [Georgenia sp. Z1344]|uniref:DinB family protein n=1 Tax=Georgenia sp. Z1344 TaxID=3416706 RepID=UPI003CEAC278
MTNGARARAVWGGVDPDVAPLDEDGRPEPPTGLGESGTLLGFLDYLRGTIDWKTRGLSPEQLGATHAPSTMTLGGMLLHLAFVEDFWLTHGMRGEPVPTSATDEEWDADPDRDWHAAKGRARADLRAEWLAAVDRSRRSVDAVLAGERVPTRDEVSTGDGPSTTGPASEAGPTSAESSDPMATPMRHNVYGDEPAPTLRWVLTHLIEEYARHAGHADLLREAIDGDTGE